MDYAFESPLVEDLIEIGLRVHLSDDNSSVSVTAWSRGGHAVTVAWDEVACSARVACSVEGRLVVTIERESVTKVSVSRIGTSINLRIRSSFGPMDGDLVVTVGEEIAVNDQILRVRDA